LQQNLAAALASIGAGFIAIDRGGRVERMNEVAQRLLRWPTELARGRMLWEVFQQVDRPAAYSHMNPVDLLLEWHTSIEQAHHVVAIARDGSHVELEVKVSLTTRPDGSANGAALIFRDLTEAMRAEAQAGLLAAIVESSFDAIISKTLDGRITSWNAAAESLFGYSAVEAIGQPITMLMPSECAAEESRIMAEIRRGVRVPPFTTVRLAKTGERIEVSLTVSPIRDAQQRIIGASKTARDVTPLRQAERTLYDNELAMRQLQIENRQIQEANRTKSLFLANMSHELRTPLNAIIGFADLLHSGMVAPGTPQHEEFLSHISTSGSHLLQLINDVLDLSKVESGKFEFFPAPVDLQVLVREVVDVLNTAISCKRIAVSVEIEVGLVDVVIDHARLKQVLYNYLSNAIKFTPEGGSVTVRVQGVGPLKFRLEVEDSGIGIAPADVERLFVDFQQLDSGHEKRHQGTGLGLSLTRKLVEAQGGSVGVHSVVNAGSVFYAVLDRVHGASRGPVIGAPEAPIAAPAAHLLVIEPPADDRPTLAPSLSKAGFIVDVAADAEQACAHASSVSYDAIALELMLADGHGLEALARIRRQGKSMQAPVLGITMPADAASFARFAVANILTKPISADEVRQALAGLARPGRARATVMVIDDDPMALQLMASTLAGIGIDAVPIQDGRVALRDIDLHRPDAIVLDLMMPGFDGFAVLDALQGMPGWRNTPVFVWTSMVLTEQEYQSLASSAHAVLSKGGGAMAAMVEGLRRWRPLIDASVGEPHP
jgi:PAS domain S-box-containing protein